MNATTHPNGLAPTISPDGTGGTFVMGGKGGRSMQAWQYVWDNLSTTDYKPAHELAELAAQKFGLKPVTVTVMLARMASTGVLDQSMLPIPTRYERGKGFTAQRKRVHYRIAQQVPAGE